MLVIGNEDKEDNLGGVGPRTDADIVVGEAQHIGHNLLAGIRRLGAGPDGDGAVLVRLSN